MKRPEQGTSRWWAVPLLALTTAIVLLPGNNLLPLVDRDEPRFAQATSEMIERGEWVIPYFNGEYRFDKPVLIYWMMRASYAVFGDNEFGARFPSVVCAFFLAWLVLRMGRRWFSYRAGFFAAFGLLTCFQMLMHGRSAVADMPMVWMTTLAQYALFELLHEEDRRRATKWFWLLYLALGLGFLAKGPVTLVVPLLTLLLQRLVFWRRPLAWRHLRLAAGLPISLALVAAWGIPALLRTHGEFLTVGMGKHVLERGWASFQGHGAFVLYYLGTAFLSLFPWIVLAGDGVSALRRNWNEKNAFLASWVLGTYLLFSLYNTKLPHYVLPAFPALFLVLGQGVEVGLGSARWPRLWTAVTLPFTAILAGAAFFYTAWKALPVESAGPEWALTGLCGIFLALAALAWLWWSGAERFSVLPLAAVAACVLLLSNALRQASPAVQVLDVFREMPPDAVYGFHGYKEPSLVFYSNRRWEALGTVDELKSFIERHPRVLAVTLERETRPGGRTRDYTDELAALNTTPGQVLIVEGLNIARASRVRLRVYRRL